MSAFAPDTSQRDLGRLGTRLDGVHAQRRLDLERRHHQRVVAWHRRFFHIENWYSIHGFIRNCLRAAGLHRRGQENARKVQLRENSFILPRLPDAFAEFRILHLSDLHLDMDLATTAAIADRVQDLNYDICVLTGDYRANTFGDSSRAMALMTSLRAELREPVYAVLGNHDSIHMVPRMEDLGIRVLMNEGIRLIQNGESIGLAGIDDAHYFHLDDIPTAARSIAQEPVKILLSHTPEVFDRAAEPGFDVFLCGHTHGGQICLPGGIPLTLEASCPRFLGKGPWQYGQMQGYTSAGASTSVVNVRLNCPPEVTIHTLEKAPERAPDEY
ncbi:metallophosphoesterase [Gilvimarinus sp. F26214L]|uniref:metallophosphoesterase n=1 Tax=Gilvimarinus sp. DZF01 TaxID=3461371 RepID=UPI004045924F